MSDQNIPTNATPIFYLGTQKEAYAAALQTHPAKIQLKVLQPPNNEEERGRAYRRGNVIYVIPILDGDCPKAIWWDNYSLSLSEICERGGIWKGGFIEGDALIRARADWPPSPEVEIQGKLPKWVEVNIKK